ncbi:MAG: hypothetical protein HKN50_11720 [Gammaproteobacteria bacterium]|nr:hypothetical protein [Gammaproteobacteria bacterium]
MNLSVEISLYPLHVEYKDRIKDFLEKLNASASNSVDKSVEIRSNNMSTRLFGEFDAVHQLLTECMRYSMQKYGKQVFVCKFIEGDTRELSGYD